MNNEKWVGRVTEDENDELVLLLPDNLITLLGWDEDEILVWEDNKNNTWTLRPQKDKK